MVDVTALVAALTLEEKVALLAGEDLWSTVGVERLGIPTQRVTDGPSGARGAITPGVTGTPSTCIPCGTAMGATWDPALAERMGALVGREALERGCRALLAPTVNLHRAVLAGRNFECYSEDPLLSGKLAAGFVRGVQSAGVIATVKHFVGNEQETERFAISSEIDERSLRELYLVPFELAVREGGALGIMTSYNRLNGRWLTLAPELLVDVLRHEWGFGGLVMTDWFAVADTNVSLGAGLDLEMPGPARAFGDSLFVAVKAGRVAEPDVDDAIRRQLNAWDQIGALDGPTPPMTMPAPLAAEDQMLVRSAAAASMVLLRNDGVLPFAPERLRRLAVVGPNADAPRIMGGGSSEVTPRRLRSPLDALREVLGDVEIVHERGCEIERSARPLGAPGLRAPDGFTVEVFATPDCSGDVVARTTAEQLRLVYFEPPADDLSPGGWSVRASGRVLAAETGAFRLALAQNGRARLLVDGAVVLDGTATPPPPGGIDVFGFISQDLVSEVAFEAGQLRDVVLEYSSTEATIPCVRAGFRLPDDPRLVERAVEAARSADVAVVVVGTSSEWESEGHDRLSFSLPGAQDELVRRAAAANPNTVVVVNAGAAVDLPWADDVAAVLQCWFGGEEMADALAEVLCGSTEPGGRLPMTVPVRIEHSPSWGNFPGENGTVRYGEGLFVGYRGHEHRAIGPRFPFGHGLGYTTFELGAPDLSSASFTPGATLIVRVPVTNIGDRPGSEVVQVYVEPVGPRLARPLKELRAFAKITLDPGESAAVELVLDDRAFAYWDPGQSDWDELRARLAGMMSVEANPPHERRAPGWQVDTGRYRLHVGRSSADIAATVEVDVSTP